MENNEKQYYIYMNITGAKVPVTQEVFKAFYAESSKHRYRQQRDGYCCCPRKKWYRCDTDCENCCYRCNNCKIDSLDAAIFSESGDGSEMSLYEVISGNTLSTEETVQMRELLRHIEEIMPEISEMGKLRDYGLTDAEIAKMVRTPRTTLYSRIKKLHKMLESDLPDGF